MDYSLPLDEKQLVSDLQNPRTARQGFDLLVRTYGEKMYWQIRRIVADHDDANDILQNCFIKAWNNIDNFRGDAKLSTWLFKIAVNESLNFVNKAKNRPTVSTDEEAGLANRLEADAYFDGNEIQIALQEAIASLPDKQRLVFNMRYFDEMKYEEISEVLGTSVGALKASYHHAMKKIEEKLKEKEIFI